jgi:hypothetical protein
VHRAAKVGHQVDDAAYVGGVAEQHQSCGVDRPTNNERTGKHKLSFLEFSGQCNLW